MRANAHRPLAVNDLVRQAATSPCAFARRFHGQIGTAPLQWLVTARVRGVQELLETTHLLTDETAAAAGFDGAAVLRDWFRGTPGVPAKRTAA